MIKDNDNDDNELYNYNESNGDKEEIANNEINIIDELINSLDIENLDLKIEVDNDKDKNISKRSSNSLFNKEITKVKSEYEIIMNCDDSDYIIYYKK